VLGSHFICSTGCHEKHSTPAPFPAHFPFPTFSCRKSKISCPKAESTDALPHIFFSSVLDHIRELKLPLAPLRRVTLVTHQRSPLQSHHREASRSPTPNSQTTARPRPSSPYRNKRFAESDGSSRTTHAGVTPTQREQPRTDTGERSCNSCAYFLLTNPDIVFTVATVVPRDGKSIR